MPQLVELCWNAWNSKFLVFDLFKTNIKRLERLGKIWAQTFSGAVTQRLENLVFGHSSSFIFWNPSNILNSSCDDCYYYFIICIEGHLWEGNKWRNWRVHLSVIRCVRWWCPWEVISSSFDDQLLITKATGSMTHQIPTISFLFQNLIGHELSCAYFAFMPMPGLIWSRF